MHYILWGHSHSPDRLDPTEFHFRFNALWAGDNGRGNPTNYANCEHTEASDRVRRVAGEQRRQAARKAQEVMSEDCMCIPITPAVRYGAYDTQAVEPGGLGEFKLQAGNWVVYTKTEATGADGIVINHLPVFGESLNYQVFNDAALIFAWSNIFFSPLVSYDENYQLMNVLADEVNVNEEATRFEITLKDDIQFTNGEKITAEDVRWTMEDFIRANADQLPKLQKVPIDSSEVVDEKNLVLEMSTPFPALLTRNMPRQGIHHKETAQEAGAEDNPREFMSDMDPVVSSGPLQIDNFQQGQLIDCTPNENHPMTPNGPVTFQIFGDIQSAFREFQNGSLNMIQQIPPTIANEQVSQVENAEPTKSDGFMHDAVFYPQHSWSPGQFTEFNAAVGAAMDAKQMAQVGQYGDAKPHNHSITIPPNHPWYPGTDGMRQLRNDDGSPDLEKARSLLEEAGWSWDDNDRLRYPDDKDVSPQWPQGEQPADYPDQWPCVQEIQR
jgi:peptide/nickel transport system substrate-binding protein